MRPPSSSPAGMQLSALTTRPAQPATASELTRTCRGGADWGGGRWRAKEGEVGSVPRRAQGPSMQLQTGRGRLQRGDWLHAHPTGDRARRPTRARAAQPPQAPRERGPFASNPDTNPDGPMTAPTSGFASASPSAACASSATLQLSANAALSTVTSPSPAPLSASPASSIAPLTATPAAGPAAATSSSVARSLTKPRNRVMPPKLPRKPKPAGTMRGR